MYIVKGKDGAEYARTSDEYIAVKLYYILAEDLGYCEVWVDDDLVLYGTEDCKNHVEYAEV